MARAHEPHSHAPAPLSSTPTVQANPAKPQSLPPLPAGVSALEFGEFFVRPVGRHGLTLTPKLQSLDGKRVRLLGYMVRQEDPTPGTLLLAPAPNQTHEHEYGLADDLPPITVRVSVPTASNKTVPFTPGPLLLTGILSVGSRSEPDGRISLVRLALDPPALSPKASGKATTAPKKPAAKASAPKPRKSLTRP